MARLCDAILRGDLRKVERILRGGLLSKGADPNEFDRRHGTYPLILAVQCNRTAIVELLLKEGADPDVVGGVFLTEPLEYAIEALNVEVVELLLKHGADPNSLDDPPLCRVYHSYPEGLDDLDLRKRLISQIAILLLTYGADPNAQRGDGTTALDLAQANYDREITALIRQLIKDGRGGG